MIQINSFAYSMFQLIFFVTSCHVFANHQFLIFLIFHDMICMIENFEFQIS